MRIILLIVLLLNCSTSYAMVEHNIWKMKVDQARECVKAIIGEAENQGYEGMYAVAHGIRNRGTLKGVYGRNAPRVRNKQYSKRTWAMAMKAWLSSATGHDPTKGADHWHNVRREGENYWTKVYAKTYEIRDHVFYRSN